MKKVLLTALIALVAVIPAHAQSSSPDEPHRFELDFNPVSYLHQDGNDFWGSTLAFAMRRSDRLSYVADLSIHQTRDAPTFSTSAYRFGLRYYAPARGKITPFAQILGGGAILGAVTTTVGNRTTTLSPSRNGVAFAAGGGADYTIRPWLSWRVLQADYSLIRAGGDNLNGVRIHTGAVFHFGH
jgi:hypothetical protein